MNNILQNQEFVNLDEYFGDEKIIDGKIYKITNLINGKIYIGQTIRSLEQIWKSHIYTALNSINDSPLYNSIKLRGIENFKIEQIDSATTYSELNQKEYSWIIEENCLAPNGYNLRAGGDGKGISEETRQKMRRLKIGRTTHNKNKRRYYNQQSNTYKYFYNNENLIQIDIFQLFLLIQYFRYYFLFHVKLFSMFVESATIYLSRKPIQEYKVTHHQNKYQLLVNKFY